MYFRNTKYHCESSESPFGVLFRFTNKHIWSSHIHENGPFSVPISFSFFLLKKAPTASKNIYCSI
jgi:hypothetical protein